MHRRGRVNDTGRVQGNNTLGAHNLISLTHTRLYTTHTLERWRTLRAADDVEVAGETMLSIQVCAQIFGRRLEGGDRRPRQRSSHQWLHDDQEQFGGQRDRVGLPMEHRPHRADRRQET